MSRPIHLILKTNEQGKKFCNVMFHSGAAERYLTCIKLVACLRCDICMCMKAEELWRSTYVTAWQNKLEYNYPTMFCCCMVRYAPPCCAWPVVWIAGWLCLAPPLHPVLGAPLPCRREGMMLQRACASCRVVWCRGVGVGKWTNANLCVNCARSFLASNRSIRWASSTTTGTS